MFIYGGEPLYDHRQAFLGNNGYSRFFFRDQFPKQTFRTRIGWSELRRRAIAFLQAADVFFGREAYTP